MSSPELADCSTLTYESWKFQMSGDWDYVNLTRLAEVYDLNLKMWSACPTIRGILQHLEDLELDPKHRVGGQLFARIELLPTILTPNFMSPHSLSVSDKMVPSLIDHKISKADTQMGEDFFIALDDIRTVAEMKVTVAAQSFHNSEQRLCKVKKAQVATRWRGVRCAEGILQDIREAVPEVRHVALQTLQQGIVYEIAIRRSTYRLLLAQLMVHAMQK